MVRRKSNSTTPRKQRDGESSKLEGTLPEIDDKTFSPSSSQHEGTNQSGKNVGDNSPIPMDIEMSEGDLEDARQQAVMRRLLTPKPIEGKDNWGILPEPETECDQALQVINFNFL